MTEVKNKKGVSGTALSLLKSIANDLADCLPVGFDELFNKIRQSNEHKKLTPLLTLLKKDGEITLDDLIHFFEQQGYFLGINMFKTDSSIIKSGLENDHRRREIFLEFVNKLKDKEIELKKKYNIPTNYYFQGAYFEEYKLLTEIEEVLDKYKGDIMEDNVKIEIDYKGSSIMVSKYEISQAREEINRYINHMLSSGFLSEMIEFQATYINKLLNLRYVEKVPSDFNYVRTMMRLTWEFNCLPGWIGIERYRKFASNKKIVEEEDTRDLIMPDEFTLFTYHIILVLGEFYAYNYFKQIKRNPHEELSKNNNLKKFITYGETSVISKVYIYNWIKSIYEPIMKNIDDKFQEAGLYVAENTLKTIVETTSLNLIEKWHLKTISSDPYLIGVMSSFSEYTRNNKLTNEDMANKVEKLSKLFAMTSITEQIGAKEKLDKVDTIVKDKGITIFNEYIDSICSIEKFQDRVSLFDFLIELEKNIDVANPQKKGRGRPRKK